MPELDENTPDRGGKSKKGTPRREIVDAKLLR